MDFLCTIVLFFAAFHIDAVMNKCLPRRNDYTRQIERYYVFGYDFYCHFQSGAECDDTQSFIYYKCDKQGNDCAKVFVYSIGNSTKSQFGDNRLSGRYYEPNRYYNLDLGAPDVRDEGIWKCVITSGNGIENDGVTWNVSIYVKPQKEEIRLTPFKENVPAYQKINFTCEVHDVRPEYGMVLKINRATFRHGVGVNISTGDTWTIRKTFEVVFSPIYPMEAFCITEREYGSSYIWSNAFIINPVLENALKFGPSDKVVIGCIMPMDFSSSGWRRNGESINVGHMSSETHFDVKGQFDLINPNLTTARFSELSWTLPNLEKGCIALDNNAGSYECTGMHTGLGFSFKSRPRHVVVEYSPTIEPNFADDKIVFTSLEANVILHCPLCAFPTIKEYQWFKGSTDFGTSRTLLLTDMVEFDFEQYTCVAKNAHGSANLTIAVNKIANEPKLYYQADLNEKVVMECPICNGDENECNWQFDGDDVESELYIGRYFTINEIEDIHYGEYTCMAIFTVGRSWIIIRLSKPGTAEIDGMPLTGDEQILVVSTSVMAGFAVAAVVMLALIIAIIVLSIVLARKQQAKDKRTLGKPPQPMPVEASNLYERVNPAYVNTTS